VFVSAMLDPRPSRSGAAAGRAHSDDGCDHLSYARARPHTIGSLTSRGFAAPGSRPISRTRTTTQLRRVPAAPRADWSGGLGSRRADLPKRRAAGFPLKSGLFPAAGTLDTKPPIASPAGGGHNGSRICVILKLPPRGAFPALRRPAPASRASEKSNPGGSISVPVVLLDTGVET
jgi:hypothetical protein